MKTKQYAPIGTVSEGTLQTEDLLGTFAETLKIAMEKYEWQGMTDQSEAFAEYVQLIVDAEVCLIEETSESEETDDIICELIDALNDFAPPYCTFGCHEGGGSDFGWWPDTGPESLQDAQDSGYRVEINDHGNVTLYDAQGREVWAVV